VLVFAYAVAAATLALHPAAQATMTWLAGHRACIDLWIDRHQIAGGADLRPAYFADQGRSSSERAPSSPRWAASSSHRHHDNRRHRSPASRRAVSTSSPSSALARRLRTRRCLWSSGYGAGFYASTPVYSSQANPADSAVLARMLRAGAARCRARHVSRGGPLAGAFRPSSSMPGSQRQAAAF